MEGFNTAFCICISGTSPPKEVNLFLNFHPVITIRSNDRYAGFSNKKTALHMPDVE